MSGRVGGLTSLGIYAAGTFTRRGGLLKIRRRRLIVLDEIIIVYSLMHMGVQEGIMAHSLDHILIHVIFSTKNRLPILTNIPVRNELYALMASVCRDLESPAIIIGGTSDHIHALIRLSRNRRLAQVVGEAKRVTSKWIKSKGAAYAEFAWQAGYAAFSVSKSLQQKVRQYIVDQENHHLRRSYLEEMQGLFCKHGVEFSEQSI